MKIQERNNKFYTEEGIEALEIRIKMLIDLFNKEKFQMNVQVLGFGKLIINNKDELIGRITELSNLIGFRFDILKETIKSNNKEIIKEKIMWQ